MRKPKEVEFQTFVWSGYENQLVTGKGNLVKLNDVQAFVEVTEIDSHTCFLNEIMHMPKEDINLEVTFITNAQWVWDFNAWLFGCWCDGPCEHRQPSYLREWFWNTNHLYPAALTVWRKLRLPYPYWL